MQNQLNQLKPQIAANVEVAYDIANLALSQVERATQLALEQSKQNAEFARAQLSVFLQVIPVYLRAGGRFHLRPRDRMIPYLVVHAWESHRIEGKRWSQIGRAHV